MTHNTNQPTDLGLVTSIPAFFMQGMFGDNQEPTQALQVLMETRGGKRYLVSLSIAATRSMLLGITNWRPMRDFLLKQGLLLPEMQ